MFAARLGLFEQTSILNLSQLLNPIRDFRHNIRRDLRCDVSRQPFRQIRPERINRGRHVLQRRVDAGMPHLITYQGSVQATASFVEGVYRFIFFRH